MIQKWIRSMEANPCQNVLNFKSHWIGFLNRYPFELLQFKYYTLEYNNIVRQLNLLVWVEPLLKLKYGTSSSATVQKTRLCVNIYLYLYLYLFISLSHTYSSNKPVVLAVNDFCLDSALWHHGDIVTHNVTINHVFPGTRVCLTRRPLTWSASEVRMLDTRVSNMHMPQESEESHSPKLCFLLGRLPFVPSLKRDLRFNVRLKRGKLFVLS